MSHLRICLLNNLRAFQAADQYELFDWNKFHTLYRLDRQSWWYFQIQPCNKWHKTLQTRWWRCNDSPNLCASPQLSTQMASIDDWGHALGGSEKFGVELEYVLLNGLFLFIRQSMFGHMLSSLIFRSDANAWWICQTCSDYFVTCVPKSIEKHAFTHISLFVRR